MECNQKQNKNKNKNNNNNNKNKNLKNNNDDAEGEQGTSKGTVSRSVSRSLLASPRLTRLTSEETSRIPVRADLTTTEEATKPAVVKIERADPKILQKIREREARAGRQGSSLKKQGDISETSSNADSERRGESRDSSPIASSSQRTRGVRYTVPSKIPGRIPGTQSGVPLLCRPSSEVEKADTGEDVDTGEDMDVEVDVVRGKEEGITQGKRHPGRPPTTGLGVGIRERKERERQEQKERETERKIKEIFQKSAPKMNKAWNDLLREEAELEVELTHTTTEDIASQLAEQAARVFKTADCSLNLKGDLVHGLQHAVAVFRAATTVLVSRAAGQMHSTPRVEEENQLQLQQEIRELRDEVERLKRERQMERPDSPRISHDTRKKRKCTYVESSEGEMEADVQMEVASSSPPIDTPPPLPLNLEEEHKGGEEESLMPMHQAIGSYIKGPSLGGVPRMVDVYPSNMGLEERRIFDNLLDKMEAKYKRKYEELEREKRSMLASIAQQETAPRPAEKTDLSVAKQAKLGNQEGMTPSSSSPAVPRTKPSTQGERKKKKKKRKGKKTGGDQGTPEVVSPVAQEERKTLKSSTSDEGQPGSNQGPPKIPERGEDVSPTGHIPSIPDKKEEVKWSKVIGRKADGKGGKSERGAQSAPSGIIKPASKGGKTASSQSAPQADSTPSPQKREKKGKKRVPRTAAVVVTCPPGEYRDNLRLATGKIDLASLQINGVGARRAATGAQIFEVGGPDRERKADALAERLREVLGQREGVRITRPTQTAELRVRDLGDCVEETDVLRAIAEVGGCDPCQIKVGEIKSSGRGLGTVWVRCPVAVANKVVTAKKIRVGWINARVEALERRPLQCFRCLAKGHVQAQCSSPNNRKDCCYRCGERGHLAKDCEGPVKCPVCKDSGRRADHRAGSQACTAPKEKRGAIKQPSLKAVTSVPEKRDDEPRKEPPLNAQTDMEWEPLPQREKKKGEESVSPQECPPDSQEAGDTPMEEVREEPNSQP